MHKINPIKDNFNTPKRIKQIQLQCEYQRVERIIETYLSNFRIGLDLDPYNLIMSA